MNINDCLEQLIALTKENMNILTALNESFYAKKDHVSVQVEGVQFAIPSFLSLESKIDTLQQNLENVLNAPKTGEAFTYFDGTTQKIELSGYASTPTHVDLSAVKQFGVESNNIFKDFMTPNPYVRLDISEIPNSIKHVNIKKVVLRNNELISKVQSLYNTVDLLEPSLQINYTDLYKILYNYVKDTDYVAYDSIRRLPVRECDSYGIYDITSIRDVYQDENLDEHYELVLNHDLTYTIANGTISRNIVPGDYLITNNDKVQMIVEEVYPGTCTIKVRILYGGYANLCDKTSANTDLYRLKFYKTSTLDRMKYIDEPIEEDVHICVFIAPVNDTTNIQAPWGTGLYINTDKLIDEDGVSFRDYYNKYVNNVGDALFAITHMMSDDSQVEKLNQERFDVLSKVTPTFNDGDLVVTQINKHLNDSSSVQHIRGLYNQKVEYKNQLDTLQSSINQVQEQLSTISFNDTTNTRSVYEAQLSEYNTRRRELVASLQSVVNEISESANSSDVPIENAKYRIRGFMDIDTFETANPDVKVIKLDVEYRYKNRNKFTGNAETIGDYIYSDWNKMSSIYRKINPVMSNGKITYVLEDLNEDRNVISFNQLDIPISQGEIVDVRYRYIYNLGYPFVEFTSSWSSIKSVEFPSEYLANIEILDIISENNDDIRKNQYLGLMEQYGLIEHAGDMIQDQTIKYFHQPEHIASGFYTEERRIIPLRDKLSEIVGNLTDLQTEVYGAIGDSLLVTMSDGIVEQEVKSNIVNTFKTISYSDNDNRIEIDNDLVSGAWSTDLKFAYRQLTLTLYNRGDYPIKLHSLFPGDYNVELLSGTSSKFDVNNYIIKGDENTPDSGVYMRFDTDVTGNEDYSSLQRLNQFIYFRTQIAGANPLYETNAYDIVRQDALQEDVKLSINPQLSTNQIDIASRTKPLTVDDRDRDTIRFECASLSSAKRKQLKFKYYRVNESGTLVPTVSTAELNDAREPYRAAYALPYPGSLENICITNNQSYIVINPGDSIRLPIDFYYWFDPTAQVSKSNVSVTRSLAFDVRTSLFADPVTYKINISANKTDTVRNTKFTPEQLNDLRFEYPLTPNTNSTRLILNKINRVNK